MLCLKGLQSSVLTSLQRPPCEQKKVAIVKRCPLQRGFKQEVNVWTCPPGRQKVAVSGGSTVQYLFHWYIVNVNNRKNESAF